MKLKLARRLAANQTTFLARLGFFSRIWRVSLAELSPSGRFANVSVGGLTVGSWYPTRSIQVLELLEPLGDLPPELPPEIAAATNPDVWRAENPLAGLFSNLSSAKK